MAGFQDTHLRKYLTYAQGSQFRFCATACKARLLRVYASNTCVKLLAVSVDVVGLEGKSSCLAITDKVPPKDNVEILQFGIFSYAPTAG